MPPSSSEASPEPAHLESPVDDVAGAPILEPERRMSALELVLVLSSVALAAVGQLLLRRGMQGARTEGGSLAMNAATSPYVIGGLCVFAVSAVLWLAVLSRVPLSRAYPFNAITYVGILLVAHFGPLQEQVTPARWVGAGMVVTGLLLVVRA